MYIQYKKCIKCNLYFDIINRKSHLFFIINRYQFELNLLKTASLDVIDQPAIPGMKSLILCNVALNS